MRNEARRWHWIGVTGLLALGVSACVTRPVDSLPPDVVSIQRQVFPARPNDQVDILFVIDDSGSMAQEQENLGRNFQTFVENLRDGSGQPYSYRIAVASTDVGVGGIQVDPSPFQLCNNPERGGRDQYKGVLQTTIHSSPTDWDESNAGIFACGNAALGIPQGDAQLCDQLRANREWLESNCQGQGLQDRPYIENNKELQRDDADVARQFRCIGSLGVNGCFIEQPLEAARAALDRNRESFLRRDAYLAVIFITDEIDCSMSESGVRLVDPANQNFNSAIDVGFRCYVDAYNCTGENRRTEDVNGETVTFTSYTSCSENTEYLEPQANYLRFFEQDIKGEFGATRIILGGITGNPDYTSAPNPPNGPGPQDSSVVFVWERHEGPFGTVDFQSASCASVNGAASPASRIQRLLEAFPDQSTGQPTFVSICEADFGPALQQLAQRISTQLTTICVDIPEEALAADPNQVCALDEFAADGTTLIQGGIPSVQGAQTIWSITPNSPNCADPPGEPGLARVEISIDPTFRATEFGVDSLIAVTCASN